MHAPPAAPLLVAPPADAVRPACRPSPGRATRRRRAPRLPRFVRAGTRRRTTSFTRLPTTLCRATSPPRCTWTTTPWRGQTALATSSSAACRQRSRRRWGRGRGGMQDAGATDQQGSHLLRTPLPSNKTTLHCTAASAQVEEDPTGGKYAAQTGILGGAPNKLQTVNNFHVSSAAGWRWRCLCSVAGAAAAAAAACYCCCALMQLQRQSSHAPSHLPCTHLCWHRRWEKR